MNLRGLSLGTGIFSFIMMVYYLFQEPSIANLFATNFMGALGIINFWLFYAWGREND